MCASSMDIQFECDQCGGSVLVSENQVGQPCRCPNPECGCELTVPSAPPLPDPPPPADDITFECPSCRRELVVGREGAGLAVDCPSCGASVVVPGASAPVPAIPLETPAPVWTPPPPPPPVPRRPPEAVQAPRAAAPERWNMPLAEPPPLRMDQTGGVKKPALAWLLLRATGRGLGRLLVVLVTPRAGGAAGPVSLEAFRPALGKLIQGILLILGCFALNWLVHFLVKEGRGYHRGMSIGDWTSLVSYVAIGSVIIALYPPVTSVAGFVLTRLAKSRKRLADPRGLDSLIAVMSSLLLLGFFVLVYLLLLPQIVRLNDSLLHFRFLTDVLNWVAILGVLAILVRLWRSVQPLVDLLTTKLADQVAVPEPDKETPEPPAKEGGEP